MTTQRLEWIDALKCFLITIVIWGHLIQYYSGKVHFWENPIWEIIYSFHMPLFIFISGYLFKNKSNLSNSIRIKTIQLLLPGLTCATILYIKDVDLNQIKLIDIKHIFESSCLNLWYLKVLFICLMGGYIFFRSKLICIVSFIIFWLFIRLGFYDYININLLNLLCSAIGGGNGLFFLLPFFVLGYCFRYYNLYRIFCKKVFIISSLSIWYILMLYFEGPDTIYFASAKWFSSGILLYKEITQTIYRDLVALFAIIFLSVIFRRYYSSTHIYQLIDKTVRDIGRNTLGIYILQYLIIEMNLINFSLYTFCPNNYSCAVISVLIVLLFNQFVKIIQMNKYISTLLIGG